MNIEPYVSVDSLLFGKSTCDDCIALYGKPTEVNLNELGQHECEYGRKWILRFDGASKTLRECKLVPGVKATNGGIPLTWDRKFLRSACIRDGNPIESVGFIILKNFGIAVTGIHDDDRSQFAVTGFTKGDFDEDPEDDKPFDYRSLR